MHPTKKVSKKGVTPLPTSVKRIVLSLFDAAVMLDL